MRFNEGYCGVPWFHPFVRSLDKLFEQSDKISRRPDKPYELVLKAFSGTIAIVCDEGKHRGSDLRDGRRIHQNKTFNIKVLACRAEDEYNAPHMVYKGVNVPLMVELIDRQISLFYIHNHVRAVRSRQPWGLDEADRINRHVTGERSGIAH